jgi:hypothetical protein
MGFIEFESFVLIALSHTAVAFKPAVNYFSSFGALFMVSIIAGITDHKLNVSRGRANEARGVFALLSCKIFHETTLPLLIVLLRLFLPLRTTSLSTLLLLLLWLNLSQGV